MEWLFSHPNIYVASNSLDLALRAGKVKQKLKIALTDCYVLAVSKIENAKAVFRRREREIKGVIDIIENNYNILFLEDF